MKKNVMSIYCNWFKDHIKKTEMCWRCSLLSSLSCPEKLPPVPVWFLSYLRGKRYGSWQITEIYKSHIKKFLKTICNPFFLVVCACLTVSAPLGHFESLLMWLMLPSEILLSAVPFISHPPPWAQWSQALQMLPFEEWPAPFSQAQKIGRPRGRAGAQPPTPSPKAMGPLITPISTPTNNF